MDSIVIYFVAAFALSGLTVIADFILKWAALKPGLTGLPWMILAALFYGLPAFGWFFIAKKLKISTIGVIYSLSTVVLVLMVSVFYFKEKLSIPELIAIGMVIVSLVVLGRFA